MKTPEELNALKEEVENLNKKLAGLSEEELMQITGGCGNGIDTDKGIISTQCPFCGEYKDFYRTDYTYKIEHWHCCKCGDLTYFRYENRWERGYIRG